MSMGIHKEKLLTECFMLLNSTSVNEAEDIFFGKFSKDFPASFLALEKHLPCVICAHNYHAEIGCVKVNVYVEQELFRDAWDANRSPSLSILHRGIRIYVVQQNRYI
jgi:hypothetical protein